MPINHEQVNQNSKKAIEGLEPKAVWNYFYELSRIPRPSCKEEKVVEWATAYAKEHGFEINVDKKLNVCIKVPATPGYEKATTIVIQGHMDMVCEKEPTTDHDFDKDPIELIRDGEWITANETTLGADNGIGVVIGMAVVLDKSIKHGPIELLLTSDEEMGMTGAMSLQSGFITEPAILMNLDSEEDGAFYIGCAGGADTEVKVPLTMEDTPANYKEFAIKVGGLAGGHSGCEVHLNRGNANKILSAFIEKLMVEENVDVRLISFNGGSKRNAIPRDAVAKVALSQEDAAKVQKVLDTLVLSEEYDFQSYEHPKITLLNTKETAAKVIAKETTTKVITLISATTSGVVTMSQDIEGMVESSNMLSVVTTNEDNTITLACLSRSSNNVALKHLSRQIRAVGDLVGASTRTYGEYPGWQPNAQSKVLAVAKDVYRQVNKGKDAEINSIHAGLECGLLVGIYPKLDPISFGPTITGAHSPSERVRIPDVGISYELAKAIIARIAESTQ